MSVPCGDYVNTTSVTSTFTRSDFWCQAALPSIECVALSAASTTQKCPQTGVRYEPANAGPFFCLR